MSPSCSRRRRGGPGNRRAGRGRRAAKVRADDGLRASTDSQAYRLVREFRNLCCSRARHFLTLEARRADPDYQPRLSRRFEAVLWQLVEQQPRHLLDPQYDSWADFLLAALDDSVSKLDPDQDGLLATWGDYNVVRINHPLGKIPVLGEYLNMPPSAAAGHPLLPRVQAANFGASARFAVAQRRRAERETVRDRRLCLRAPAHRSSPPSGRWATNPGPLRSRTTRASCRT